jgi:hypothetical protein
MAKAGDEGQAREIGDALLTTLARRQVPEDILAQVQARLPDTGEGQQKRSERRRPSRPTKEKK